MRYILLAGFPVLSIYLQSTFLQQIKIHDILPDFVLLFVLFFALLNGSVRGGIYGLLCGLLEDLYLGGTIGIQTLCKGIVGYCIGRMYKNVNAEQFGIGLLGILAGEVLEIGLRILLLWGMDSFRISMNKMAEMAAIQLFYQTFWALPGYFWYHHSHMQGWLQPDEEEHLWERMNKLIR